VYRVTSPPGDVTVTGWPSALNTVERAVHATIASGDAMILVGTLGALWKLVTK
jgi:hypothetical protein